MEQAERLRELVSDLVTLHHDSQRHSHPRESCEYYYCQAARAALSEQVRHAPSPPGGLRLPARPWRVGRKVGRTIYAQLGEEPTDSDPLIGTLDTRELALRAVEDHNAALAAHTPEANG